LAIAAAIFDLDGTLVNSREAVVDAVAEGVRRVLAGYNIAGIEPDRVAIEDAIGLPPKQYYQRILPENLLHLADQVQASATALEIEALKAGMGNCTPVWPIPCGSYAPRG